MMDITQLDNYLRTLTPHEQGYVQTLQNEFSLATKQAVFDQFPVIKAHSQNTYVPSDITHLKLFDCKKNSRFLHVAPHRHDYIEMNYVYSGSITQTVNGEVMHLHQDDLIILDTQVEHSVTMPGVNDIMLAFRFSVKYFTENFFREFKADNLLGEFLLRSVFERQKYNRLLTFNIAKDPTIKYLLRLLTAEFVSDNLEAESVENNYILVIFTLLLRKYEKENDTLGRQSVGDHNVQRYSSIVTYLEQHFASVTLSSMATALGYSPTYLSSLIKRITKRTFSQLLLEIRLKNALILLQQTTMPITEIYQKSGFSNANYFYRQFKQRYGSTPRIYRQLNKPKR